MNSRTRAKRIYLASAFVFIALISFYLAMDTPGSTRHDYDLICEVYTDMDTRMGSEDPAQLAFEAAEKIQQSLITSGAKAAFSALTQAAPDQKYALYKQAATEAGYPEWKCESMAALFHEH